MINADTTLNDGKRLHIIQCFINNVAMLDKPLLKKKFYAKMLKDYDIDNEEEDSDSYN